MNVDILVGRFRDHYGHTDFADEKYVEDEHAYKFERGQQMLEWLGRDDLRQLIALADLGYGVLDTAMVEMAAYVLQESPPAIDK